MSDKQDEITCFKYPPGVAIQTGTDEKTHSYYVKHYGPLIGKTIKQVTLQMFDGDRRNLMPVVEFTDGTSAAVMCDPEGNGPGHLDIQ